MHHILKFFASQYIGTGGGKVRATDEQLRYLIRSQLMLLQTDKLREICTVPPRDTGPYHPGIHEHIHEWNWNRNLEAIKEFSPFTLHELFRTKSLRNVTKFSMILAWDFRCTLLNYALPSRISKNYVFSSLNLLMGTGKIARFKLLE